MIGWNFPSNGGGQIYGVATAGIQTFKGKEFSSLARETCQNSLDAVKDETSPVTVEFHQYEIDTKDIPDYRNFMKILQACKSFWRKKSDKAEIFLKEAILRLKFPKTSVLRISDFNTTGLSKPFDPHAMEGWNALIKIDGGATKDSDSAGNFGIGKNATFANSFCRMIFYRTLNEQSERAAQGVTKLVSFYLDSFKISAGTGYYGDPRGNLPVSLIPELDELFLRNKIGTDVFIYGFSGGKNWHDELIRELIDNFLVAIHRDKLRFKVQGVTLNKNNLREFVTNNAADYYRILTGDGAVKFFELNFHGMGKLKLGVLIDSAASLNRRVLIVRKSGMKLFDLDRISRTLSFTAILELEGSKLNAFFREMETPSHDGWEPTRYAKSPALAKKLLTELKHWVRETIQSLGEVSDGESDDDLSKNFNRARSKIKTPTADGKVDSDKIRVIRVDEKNYRLVLKIPKNFSRGQIEISAVNEDNVDEKIFITPTNSADSSSQILTIGDAINTRKNSRPEIDK